eukprot:690855-Amorphochlora_amoeboformis.AAC.2
MSVRDEYLRVSPLCPVSDKSRYRCATSRTTNVTSPQSSSLSTRNDSPRPRGTRSMWTPPPPPLPLFAHLMLALLATYPVGVSGMLTQAQKDEFLNLHNE